MFAKNLWDMAQSIVEADGAGDYAYGKYPMTIKYLT